MVGATDDGTCTFEYGAATHAELAALDGGPPSADAFAVTSGRGVVLSSDHVLRVLRKIPDAAFDTISLLCIR